MRVLQVVTHMERGGLETMLMNYYRQMDRSKIQFDFLVHRQERAAYDDEIEMLGGHIYRIPRLNPFSYCYRSALNLFFKEHPYRIAHVHLDCMSAIPLSAAKKSGVMVRIAHSHSSNQDKNIKYIMKQYYKKKIFHYSTDLLACSQTAGEWMFGDHTFEIMANAIDSERYLYSKMVRDKVRKNLDLFSSLVIGHVGRFNYPKNHHFLINIFYELHKIQPNAKLMLVGDGIRREEIERKVKQLGLIDSVIFMGVRSDVNELLQAMDIFVFPSLYEGLPVTLIEAQAAGLPCVISDHISQECIVTNDLVTVQNLSDSAETWARHILSLPGKERSNRSAEIEASGFDIVENAKWLEEFYLERSK